MESSFRIFKKRSHNKETSKRNSKPTMVAGASLTTGKSIREKENSNKDTYIKIPLDSYTYLSGLENQVDMLEDKVSMLQDRVNDLTADLYAADLEITAKDALLKQHEKVATETVSEAQSLKNQLESSTTLKVTAEDRVLNLDTALKESMKQIKPFKEENDQKLHELSLNKTQKWEKIKEGLEAQIADLNHRLLQSASERAALSRSVQEQSNMLIEINEQKSQVEVDNELLKGDIQSYENEISSLKYDLHVVTKDIEIQKEEKNMGKRSAEASNKKQLEDVKKMAKPEAECQRLRNLVPKKLPVPAALTNMKKGTGNTNHNYVEPTRRKPPVPGRSSKSPLLTEKEIKKLKEALVTKDSDLQSSSLIFAKMAGKFKNIEVQIGALNQKINSWQSTLDIPAEGCVILNANSSRSALPISEDESSYMLQEAVPVFDFATYKSSSKWNKPVTANSMEIMDDFIEMERLACSAKGHDPNLVQMLLFNILSNISLILESQAKDTDMRKALDHIVHVMQGLESSLLWNILSISRNEFRPNDLTYNIDSISQNIIKIAQSYSSSILVNKPDTDAENSTDNVLVAVISRIHQLVLSADRKVMQAQENGMDIESEDLTDSMDSFLLNKMILADFFLDLSHVLLQASELNFNKRIKFQLHEKEQLILDIKSKLAESQKELKVTTENLENMLQEEKRDHHDSLIRYMNLKDKVQRSEREQRQHQQSLKRYGRSRDKKKQKYIMPRNS